MSDEQRPRLDITDVPAAKPSPDASGGRPFLSVMFSCCRVYQRVYATADGRRYEGRCPRCMRTIRFIVGPGGTSERTFVVE